MYKTAFGVLATAALVAASPASAQTFTLDFEGAEGYVNPILNFYNGGTDSLGQSGPNLGVSFAPGAVALSNDALGPYYANAPTPVTVMYAFDATAIMNVAAGFSGSMLFQYASVSAVANAVQVYSGLDGTGTLLGSFSLMGNASSGCTGAAYCRFDLATLAFAGIARSVSFAGGSPNVLFDDITITAVPEPATYALLAAGLAAIGLYSRRRNPGRSD